MVDEIETPDSGERLSSSILDGRVSYALISMNIENHEQLSTGLAAASDEPDATTVRINPIPEGERTRGQSGEETVWNRDPLENAVENGALDGALIVKGEGGQNPHFPLDEQVPPENILGRVDQWEYEPGVGPVGEAQLADEEIASRIELGLLDVSPDMYRRLGEYDENLGAKPVDELLAMPRITILEEGAAKNATIEPSTAEALAYNPDAEDDDQDPESEQDQDQDAPGEAGTEDTPMQEQLAVDVGDGVRWDSEAGGSREPDDERYGVVVDGLQDEADDRVLVAVYEPDSDYETWQPRGEQNPMNEENLETVGPDGVDSLPPISQVVDSEQAASNADERAESRAGSSQTPTMEKEELQEQLSEAQSRVSELESTKEQLAEENDELEEQLADAREEKEDLENEKEDLEEELADLRDDFGPIKEAIAQLAAEDSALSGEQVADRFEGGEIIEMLADEDDDRSPAEQVQEQLAAGVEPRGESESDSDDEPLDEEQLAEADELAYEVMSGSDIAEAHEEQLSPREYVRDYKGADPAKVDSARELRNKVLNEGGE